MLFSKILMIGGGNLWEKLLVWYENSLIKDIGSFLEETVFRVDFGVYDNFSVGSGVGGTIRNVIIGLMFGMVIAAAVMFYTRTVHGRFIRTLLRGECFSAEHAMTLRDAGAFRVPSIRRELTKGGALAKLIRCVEAESYDETKEKKPFAPDFTKAHFYIPEDLKYRADVRYDRSGSGGAQFAITLVVCVAVAVLLCRLLPFALGLADWLMSALS